MLAENNYVADILKPSEELRLLADIGAERIEFDSVATTDLKDSLDRHIGDPGRHHSFESHVDEGVLYFWDFAVQVRA
ncbi:hypothetical protein GCM10027167_50410 [Nocardia heshunensis]